MNKELITDLRQILNVGFDGELSDYEEEENDVILKAITALETSIPFTPFEFPTWEEIQATVNNTFSFEIPVFSQPLTDHFRAIISVNEEYDKGNYYVVAGIIEMERMQYIAFRDGGYNEEDIKELEKWLNNRKRELATQLAE